MAVKQNQGPPSPLAAGPRALLVNIRKGADSSEVQEIQRKYLLDRKQLANLLRTSVRTLDRRMVSGVLSEDLTDRMIRVSRVLAQATELFEGDRLAAVRWLQNPSLALEDCTPWDLLGTETGTELVERLIGRLENSTAS